MELGGFVSTGAELSFEAVVLELLLPLVLHEEINRAAPAKTKTRGLIMVYRFKMNASKLKACGYTGRNMDEGLGGIYTNGVLGLSCLSFYFVAAYQAILIIVSKLMVHYIYFMERHV